MASVRLAALAWARQCTQQPATTRAWAARQAALLAVLLATVVMLGAPLALADGPARGDARDDLRGDARADGALIRQGDQCLEVNAPQPRLDGARVWLQPCDGRPAQRWRIDGEWIRHGASDRCLEVNAPDVGADGARVQVAACRRAAAQSWRNERGRFVVRVDGRCLAVHAPDAGRAGAHVETASCAPDGRNAPRDAGQGARLQQSLQQWVVELPRRPPVVREREAGPLWNDADAARRCPAVCAPDRWRGAWRTTVRGRMSVCGCELADPRDARADDPDRDARERPRDAWRDEPRDERYADGRAGRDDDRASVPRPIPAGQFAALQAALAAQAFGDGKLQVLATAAEHNAFTIAQLRRIVDDLVHSGDRLRAVEIAAPVVVDPENAFQLLDAFTFDSEKAQVREAFAAAARAARERH